MVTTPQDELSIPDSEQLKILAEMEPPTIPSSNIREPAWKKPTRPCPFYSQGKCLFSDTCSFLHDVKIKVRRASDAAAMDEPTRILGNPPMVTGLTSPGSPRSPDRSPRMTSLLLALKDVIGEDIDIGEEEVEDEELVATHEVQVEDHAPPDVVSEISNPPQEEEVEGEKPVAAREVQVEEHFPTGVVSDIPNPPQEEVEDEEPITAHEVPVEDHVPTGVVPGIPNPPEEDEAESAALARPPSREQSSDCSSRREDSIDSGYGDGVRPQSPTYISPRNSRSSALNLLGSPFGGFPSVQVLYPNMARGSLYSPHSPFTGSFSDSATSPKHLDRASGYFSHRNSIEPSHARPTSTLERPEGSEDEPPSPYPKEEAGNTSDSSLSSLDTLPPSPSEPDAELPQDDETQTPPAELLTGLGQESIAVLQASSFPESGPELLAEPEASSLATPGQPWLHRSRASSDLTIMASKQGGTSHSPSSQPYNLAEMDEEADLPADITYGSSGNEPRSTVDETVDPVSPLDSFERNDSTRVLFESSPKGVGGEEDASMSIYDRYNSSSSDHVWSPPAPMQNFSRPSSVFSIYDPALLSKSPTRASSSQTSLRSPFQEVVVQASTSSLTRSASERRNDEPSSTKVPFGFRNSKRRNFKPQPIEVHERPSSSLSTRSLNFAEPPSSTSLRPLRLSTILTSPLATSSSSDDKSPDSALPSPSVLSDYSISDNRLLSSARSSIIPEHVRNTLVPANDLSPLMLSGFHQTNHLSNFDSPTSISPQSPTGTNISTWNPSASSSSPNYQHSYQHVPNDRHGHKRTLSRLSSAIYLDEDEEQHEATHDLYDETVRISSGDWGSASGSNHASPPYMSPLRGIQEEVPRSRPVSRATSIKRVPVPIISEAELRPRPPPSRSASATPHGGTPLHSPTEMPQTAPIAFTRSPIHAIATPRPTLMFAIASDNVEEVERVLNSGEAGPNDQVGPQSALEFALTNDQLLNKMDIVKTLLAYGADPSALARSSPTQSIRDVPSTTDADVTAEASPADALQDQMDPATKYFVARADAAHTRKTSALIHRSFFRPLTRMRYDVIGQDCAFEQLFRVLSMHSQQLSVTPVVVLLCGPSGHGKSLVARKFGSLLDVPTHTVNMTTLRSTHDLWQSYSMDPYEEPSTSTLAEFLTENEGKRCVVVLDEIDKVVDEKALWSLLMPWELGRCSFEAGRRHVNVRNVIWLGTANVGHQLVFDHQEQRMDPDSPMGRQEYVRLVELFRPDVSKCLGPSLLSRVTTVLPFIPFTTEEQMALATQALFALGKEMARSMSPKAVENLVSKSLEGYLPPEGARSLYRAVSTQLLEALDAA